MIATQGEGNQLLRTLTKTFTLEYSLDNSNWYNVTENSLDPSSATKVGKDFNFCVFFHLQ